MFIHTQTITATISHVNYRSHLLTLVYLSLSLSLSLSVFAHSFSSVTDANLLCVYTHPDDHCDNFSFKLSISSFNPCISLSISLSLSLSVFAHSFSSVTDANLLCVYTHPDDHCDNFSFKLSISSFNPCISLSIYLSLSISLSVFAHSFSSVTDAKLLCVYTHPDDH